MCGIAGASLSPLEQANAKKVAKAMLLSIESRGRDATGFAFRERNGAIQVHKADKAASQFVQRNLCLPKRTRTFITHTRFATQGEPKINGNNHPIKTGNVVGVHNGCVSNDWEIFRKLDNTLLPDTFGSVRLADVDSEAIFALLNFGTVSQKDALETIKGSAAIAWMNDEDEADTLHLARISSSPLFCAETEAGSMLFASTPEAIAAGAKAGGMKVIDLLRIPEGCYMKVVNGIYEIVEEFNPAEDDYRYVRTVGSNYMKVSDSRASSGQALASQSHLIGSPGRTSTSPHHGITDRMSGVHKESDGFGNGVEPLSTQAQLHLADAGEFIVESGEVLGDEDAMDRRTVEEYEQWWEANCQALEDAVDRDDDADHRAFASFMTSPMLNSYYLNDPSYTIERPTEAEYLSEPRNARREATVAKWMGSLTATGEALEDACFKLHADIRPGDTVVTDVEGLEVYGHLYCAPETFPHGHYTIRAYMARRSYPGEFEAIFISRRMDEFHQVGQAPLPENGFSIDDDEAATTCFSIDGGDNELWNDDDEFIDVSIPNITDAKPTVTVVSDGPYPFGIVMHDSDAPPRQTFAEWQAEVQAAREDSQSILDEIKAERDVKEIA